MSKRSRSLYCCFNAKVHGDKIYCDKGYKLGHAPDGILSINRLIRGTPMECGECKDCPDYDEMGEPVAREDRGWASLIHPA